MDDSLCLRFFLEPTDTLHRRYEVLRAFFVERRPLDDIAQRSGYSYNTVRDLIGAFRAQCREGRVPPFSRHLRWADRRGTPRTHPAAWTPRRWPTVANRTSPPDDASGPASPESSCSYPCWRLGFDQIVRHAGYPGSLMVPATSALLSLLTLKLLDKERRSHISDFNFDEALGLFAGLNVLPKSTYAADYSYRTHRAHQQQLLSGWISRLAPLLLPQGKVFSLDFHAIPFRGDPAALDNHFLPRRGKAGPGVLSFFAQEAESRVLCYANANLTRTDQPGELMQFVEFWHGITGHDPQWLYFDSKVVPYPELSRVNQRGIHLVTIRRRGAAAIRRLRRLPSQAWQRAVIDTPKRCHQQIRFVDEMIRLPGHEGPIRQVAVDGLGREQPTLFLSHNVAETARNLIIRYAGRNAVEDGLGTSVNFFHLDCLASEVRLNVDLDVALTVLANGCYRWLAHQLHGFDRSAPKQVYRKFVETGGQVEVQPDRIVVRFDKRSHNPILREAELDKECPPIPWLGDRRVAFAYP